MNRRKIIELLVALMSGISVALGQIALLSLLFSSFVAAKEAWVLISLLCLNCGMAVIALFYLDRRD